MPLWLVALFFGAFILYTDDYIIAGILPEIARDLRVTEATAGHLVTAFSLTLALAAPAVAIIAHRVPPRILLATSFSLFVVANATAVIVDAFWWMLALRVLAAVAAGGATPLLFASAAERAPSNLRGRYVAFIALGVTGSLTLGVPLGTWISGTLGWRATFAALAACGVLALVALLITFRDTPRESPPSIGGQLRGVLRPALSFGLLSNLLLMAGTMMLLTYLAPYLAETTGSSWDERALAFSLAGVAGMIGIWGGGAATDRWGPSRALSLGTGAIVLSMVGLWTLWLLRPSPFPVALGILSIWGAAAFWNTPALQTRLAQLAGPLAAQALAANTSATYLGISAGAALGASLMGSTGVGALAPIAAVCALAAIVLVRTADRFQCSDRSVNHP